MAFLQFPAFARQVWLDPKPLALIRLWGLFQQWLACRRHLVVALWEIGFLQCWCGFFPKVGTLPRVHTEDTGGEQHGVSQAPAAYSAAQTSSGTRPPHRRWPLPASPCTV